MMTSWEIHHKLIHASAELRAKAAKYEAEVEETRKGTPTMDIVAKFVVAGARASAYTTVANHCMDAAHGVCMMHLHGDEDPVRLSELLHNPARQCVGHIIAQGHIAEAANLKGDCLDVPIAQELKRGYMAALDELDRLGV